MSYTIYFDTETGGVLPSHPTIQLAAIAVEDGTWNEAAGFERKIKFNEADADPEALKINHYEPEVWRLRWMFAENFFPFSYHVKDTLQRALWFFDEHPELTRPPSLKLSVLCEYFGIVTAGAHDALADVRMSVAIARAFAEAERK